MMTVIACFDRDQTRGTALCYSLGAKTCFLNRDLTSIAACWLAHHESSLLPGPSACCKRVYDLRKPTAITVVRLIIARAKRPEREEETMIERIQCSCTLADELSKN